MAGTTLRWGIWRRWFPQWARLWAADSAVLLGSQFGAIIATSALAILLARQLGPSDWGLFSGFLGLSLALSVFIEFGLTQWLLRELARIWVDRDDPSPRVSGRLVVASLSVNATLGLAIVAGAGVVAVVVHLAAGSVALLLALVAYGAFLAAASGLEAVFRARRKLSRVIVATLVEKSLLLLLVSMSFGLGLGLWAVAVAYVFAGVARVGTDLVLIRQMGVVEWSAPKADDVRHVTRHSVPFAMNRASLNIIPKLDTFILAALAPVAAGYFALGDRILGPVVIIPVVMSSALYPFLAREAAGSRAAWKVVFALSLVGVAVAAIAIAAAPTLVPIVFGADYASAVPAIQVMLVATPFVFGANPLLTHLYTERLERPRLGFTLGCVSLVGTGAVVLGQIAVGATGAAGGYVLRAMLMVGVLTLAGLRRDPRDQTQSERSDEDVRRSANGLAPEKEFA
jgi:O-antigen/teichoic acid export membrane protein